MLLMLLKIMTTHEIQTTNSFLGTILSVFFAVLSLAEVGEIVKIVAGAFAIAASAVTIYYTVRNNRKK